MTRATAEPTADSNMVGSHGIQSAEFWQESMVHRASPVQPARSDGPVLEMGPHAAVGAVTSQAAPNMDDLTIHQ
jgi:hypothetical protein